MQHCQVMNLILRIKKQGLSRISALCSCFSCYETILFIFFVNNLVLVQHAKTDISAFVIVENMHTKANVD